MIRVDSPHTSGAGGIGDIDLGPNGSVQLMFAKLQLLMANEAKVKAETCIQKIESVQDDQQKALKLISKARNLQNDAKTDVNAPAEIKFVRNALNAGLSIIEFLLKAVAPPSEREFVKQMINLSRAFADGMCDIMNFILNPNPYKSEITPELKKFFEENGLVLVPKGSNGWINEKEWELNIKTLDTFQNTLPAMTQTMMIQAQNFMGQYNSFMIGASSAISEAKATLNSLQKA